MFTATVPAEIPPAGPLRIAGIDLPTGRRLRADFGDGRPVGWVAEEPLEGQPLTELVRRLASVFDQTGLWPVAVDGLAGDGSRPWLSDEFGEPDDRVLPAAELLAEAAAGTLPADGSDYESPARYLGLADSVRAPISPPISWSRSCSAMCRPVGCYWYRCSGRPMC